LDKGSSSFTPTEAPYPGRMVISSGKVCHRLKSFPPPGPLKGIISAALASGQNIPNIMIGVIEKFGFCTRLTQKINRRLNDE
jgi:hypothetical protein